MSAFGAIGELAIAELPGGATLALVGAGAGKSFGKGAALLALPLIAAGEGQSQGGGLVLIPKALAAAGASKSFGRGALSFAVVTGNLQSWLLEVLGIGSYKA